MTRVHRQNVVDDDEKCRHRAKRVGNGRECCMGNHGSTGGLSHGFSNEEIQHTFGRQQVARQRHNFLGHLEFASRTHCSLLSSSVRLAVATLL